MNPNTVELNQKLTQLTDAAVRINESLGTRLHEYDSIHPGPTWAEALAHNPNAEALRPAAKKDLKEVIAYSFKKAWSLLAGGSAIPVIALASGAVVPAMLAATAPVGFAAYLAGSATYHRNRDLKKNMAEFPERKTQLENLAVDAREILGQVQISRDPTLNKARDGLVASITEVNETLGQTAQSSIGMKGKNRETNIDHIVEIFHEAISGAHDTHPKAVLPPVDLSSRGIEPPTQGR